MPDFPAPAITVENAHLRYQRHILFENLTFHLPAAKTTCLLGPSGIGKTSLLRLIAALPVNQDTEQTATIKTGDGLSLENRISYMAQTDLLLPWLTCLENTLIGHQLRNHQHQEATQQAIHLLQQVGLSNALHKYPAQLSGGMRQRVALVRTLMENRPVILMDEPFSALDTITRLQIQEMTAHLIQHKTVLLITHDPLEALRLGHQVIVMSGQPARFAEPILLTTPPPRSLTDSLLLEWQGRLMEQLAHAKGAMI